MNRNLTLLATNNMATTRVRRRCCRGARRRGMAAIGPRAMPRIGPRCADLRAAVLDAAQLEVELVEVVPGAAEFSVPRPGHPDRRHSRDSIGQHRAHRQVEISRDGAARRPCSAAMATSGCLETCKTSRRRNCRRYRSPHADGPCRCLSGCRRRRCPLKATRPAHLIPHAFPEHRGSTSRERRPARRGSRSSVRRSAAPTPASDPPCAKAALVEDLLDGD